MISWVAHGQCSDLAGQEVFDFLAVNNNIQKLDLLYNIYRIIAEIISSYVVYKDKISTDNFRKDIEKKTEKIANYRQRMSKSNFDNYCKPFYKKECLERASKKIYREQIGEVGE